MVAEITVQTLQEWLEKRKPVYLLDVRQPWEHELAALPGCVLVPLGDLLARGREIQPPAQATIVVYCHHGIRSRSGAAILQQLGFENVVSLTGGIDAWSRQIDPSVPLY